MSSPIPALRPRAAAHVEPGAASPLAGTSGGRLELLRANLTRTSEVFRHALRVGVNLAVAVAISHLFPLGHGY